MIRKLKTLFIFYLAVTLFVIACCKPPLDYFIIDSLNVELTGKQNYSNISQGDTLYYTNNKEYVDSNLANTDTMYLSLILNTMYVAENQINFISSAYASKCKSNGKYGLKNKIKKIQIMSNQPFQNRAAYSSINDLLNFQYSQHYGDPQIHTHDSVVNFLNTNKFYFNPVFISIPQKPNNNSHFRFITELEFEDGQKIRDSSVVLKWE